MQSILHFSILAKCSSNCARTRNLLLSMHTSAAIGSFIMAAIRRSKLRKFASSTILILASLEVGRISLLLMWPDASALQNNNFSCFSFIGSIVVACFMLMCLLFLFTGHLHRMCELV